MNNENIYNTGKVRIGCQVPRGPRMDFTCTAPDTDMLRLQNSLVGTGSRFRHAIDWDGVYIALGCAVAAATALLWYWSK